MFFSWVRLTRNWYTCWVLFWWRTDTCLNILQLGNIYFFRKLITHLLIHCKLAGIYIIDLEISRHLLFYSGLSRHLLFHSSLAGISYSVQTKISIYSIYITFIWMHLHTPITIDLFGKTRTWPKGSVIFQYLGILLPNNLPAPRMCNAFMLKTRSGRHIEDNLLSMSSILLRSE